MNKTTDQVLHSSLDLVFIAAYLCLSKYSAIVGATYVRYVRTSRSNGKQVRRDDASNDATMANLAYCIANAVNRRAVTKRTDKIPLGLEYRI